MLLRALLQTSLVLWLAQETLQGGVKPQNVAYGKALPARGIGIGVKPGVPSVTGALGALGSRYGTKAMKTGIGRYPGAHLGVGGYRSLGMGGRAGLKQGGYGTHGAYGASLGTGMALGPGLANGFGLGLGQGGKRAYGAGLGTLPGYGPYAGIGYPGARPGVSAADLGGPEVASLGQAVQDLKRQKSRALGHLYGIKNRIFGHETPSRSFALGPTVPELHAGIEVKSLDPGIQTSSLRPRTSPEQDLDLAVSQAQGGERNDPAVSRRKPSHEATLAAGGGRRQLPADKDNIRILGSDTSQGQSDYDLSLQQKKKSRNCGSPEVLDINRFDLLGSETQHSQSLVPEPHLGVAREHLGRTHPPAQGEKRYQLPLSQGQGVSSSAFSSVQGQGTRNYLSAGAGRRDAKGPEAGDISRLKMRGIVTVEDGGQRYGPVIPSAGGTHGLSIPSAGEGQEAQGFIAEGQDAKHLSQAEHINTKSKTSSISGQTGRNTNAARLTPGMLLPSGEKETKPKQTDRDSDIYGYIGGAGNYMGASLGAGGYGAGLGQGAYLGGAAGKLGAAAALGQGGYPQGVAGKSNGYGDGVTGYLGAVPGNGYAGYGNGYGDGYGAELADGAENKARKSEALSTGGYAGQVQGAYGALGTGLESTGGKYGAGAAQVPYGNAPVIPAGLEGDGGYPYATQQLSHAAEGGKTTNKFGAPAGYGAQQPGYGAQLGVTQDALGEHTGKYGGVNPVLGNGYKG